MSRKINIGADAPKSGRRKRSQRTRQGPVAEDPYAAVTKARKQRHFENQIKFNNEPGVLHIFTDGSCMNTTTKQGGWAAKLMWNGNAKTIYGGRSGVTNNIMEFTAILEGLRARKRDVPTIVYTDSQYCIDCLTTWWRGWERRGWITAGGTPVKNVELIQAITPLITDHVRFSWVKGHNGDENNEHVDEWAAEGRRLYGSLANGGRNEQTQFTSAAQDEGSSPREGSLPSAGAASEGGQ